MEENGKEVEIAGILGCHVHKVAYQIAQIKTPVDALQRFLLMCPEEGCTLGIRITALVYKSVDYTKKDMEC